MTTESYSQPVPSNNPGANHRAKERSAASSAMGMNESGEDDAAASLLDRLAVALSPGRDARPDMSH
ncbi:MAG: hypothetical protein AAGI54_08670 [Planctomycetota bacterium]